MKRRILSIITALALCLSLCPTWAFAVEGEPDTGLCDHHPEHIGCGYTAPTEGHDCGHRHTAECYTKGVLPDADGGDYYEIGADTENLLDCQHSHDSACGYVQTDPGTPCGYVCRICPIEDLIAALPEQVTADNAADVRGQLDHILDLYRELNEDEQEEINLSRIYALQGALDAANDPDPIEESVTYQEASWNGGVTYTTQTADSYTLVVGSATAVTWNEGWYVVNSTVTISEPITVTGAVNLILADGCALNAEKGIVVTDGNSLTIYAQSGGTGTLNATGVFFYDGDTGVSNASAGIGGSGTAPDSGAITIHGGVINATGGSTGSNGYGGAGIGGGTPNSGNGGSSGAITIYGGTVTANSGEGGLTGAGIGGGGGDEGGTSSNITIYGGSVTARSHASSSGTGGAGIGGGSGFTCGGGDSNIQIHGGTVNATGGYMGAGIGGGADSAGTSGNGTVTISGGIVTAVGGKYAAGIGGGGGYSTQYGGCTGGTGSVTISGGIVDATGGAGNSSGQYAGDPIGNGGNAGDTAATVNKTNAIVFENGAGTVCGAVTLDGSYTVPAGYTLNIPAGASLSGSGTLSGGSAFTTENLTENMISVPEGWHYTGEDLTEKIKSAVSLNGEITICGQTFTASTDGWELSVEKVSELEYTVKYTHTDKGTLSKTVTIARGQTVLSDVVTYKEDGTTPANTFSVGETIIVKATATFPANNVIMAAAEFDTPTGEQMAVYYNDTQISAPSTVENGVHTMTVDTSNLPESALNKEIALTVKYIESDNASGADTEAKVTVTAVARVEKDSTTTYVGALADAFTDGNSGATVTLLSEVDLGSSYIRISGSHTFTLDLNGQTVKASYYGAFDISGGSLTIQDSGSGGKIESSDITIEVTGGTLSIQSGTVSGRYGVKISSGTVNISGGTISGNTTGLWVYGGGSTTLSGGTFSGSVGVQVEGNASVTLKNLLAARYAYHQNDIPVAKAEGWVDNNNIGEVPLDTKPAWLPGTVTVKECSHTGGLVPSENGYQHGGPCKCCGAELTAANHTLGADNQCSGCGAALAAKVEKSGSDTVYVEASNLADVFAEDSGNDGATITLLDNITTSKQINVGADNLTLDLNGKTYTCTQNDFHLSFVSLTIKGSGAITTSGYYCLTMDGGTLNIESGSFSAKDSAVYVENNGRLQLTGGSFTGNQNAIAYESGEVTEALANYGGADAPHYAFYQGSSPYTPSGRSLPSGTFTVQECQHTGVEVTDLGNGKHGLDCPYCGYHSEHTTTLTATVSGNTVTLNGGCGTEGCNYAAELGTVSFTFENLVYGNPNAKVSRIKDGPASLGVMLKIDNAGDYAIQGEDTTYSYSLIALFASTPMTAGDHTLKMLFYDDSNMGTETVECELPFTVAKAPLTPVIDASNGSVTKPYDGTTAALEGLAITLTGLVEGDNVTATASYAYDNANAGERTITATSITLTGADAENYELTQDSATTTGTITKATVRVTWDSTTQAVTYTGKTAEITAPTITAEGGVAVSVTPTYSYHQEDGEAGYRDGLPTNAGTYSIIASIEESGNLTAAQADMMLIIDKAPLTITGATVASKPYDGTDTATVSGVTFTGLVNGETLALGTDYTATGTFADANAGENKDVTVTVTLTSDKAKNYNLAQNTTTATGTINRASSTITTAPTATGITYGEALSGSTLTGGAGSVEGAFTWTAPTTKPNAGTAQYEVTFTPTDTNYDTATVNVSVTVAKATPTLTAPTAGAIQYGQKLSDSTLTGGTATNPNDNATVAGTWSWANGNTQPTAIGTFPVAFVPSDTANYNTPENVDTSVTVNPAEPKITLTVPAYQVAGGEVKVTCTVENPHDAAFKEGIPETVTLTYQIGSGAVETLTGTSFTIPEGTAKDTVITVIASTAAVDGKYTAATKTATVTVTDKITVEISGVGVTGRAYNGKAINHTGTPVIKTLDGKTVTDATVTYTWSGGGDTGPINAGNYTLTITVNDGKYIGSTTVDFTIEKATVTITAVNKSAVVGSAQPELTYTVSGLADGETLATVPTLTCTPDMNTVGSYSITASGAAVPNTGNYNTTITYVDGTLSVTAKPSTGGGGYVPSNPGGTTITVPVSGDKSTVNVSASVSGTTATVSKIDTSQIENVIGDNGQASMVEIDFTGLGKTIDTVNLPAAAIKDIAAKAQNEEVGGLTVKLPEAEISFDANALSAIQAQAGSQITLTVTPAKPADLNSRQKEAVGSAPVFDLTLRSSNGAITDFRGGYATVSLPYTLTAGQNPSGVVVYYLDSTGNITPCTTMYDVRSKSAIFTTGHLSLYFVGYDPASVWVNPFSDVAEGAWYYDAVRFVSENGLMGGYGNGRFGPNDTLTRAQFAQILFNKEGRPVVNYLLQYGDVATGAWYTEAVRWATSQGIVGGYGNGMFGPNDNITREQLAVMLWRYAGSPAATDKELHFTDTDKASGFALEALRWAVENGVMGGYGDGRLDPKGLATRAQVAQMLKNYLEK